MLSARGSKAIEAIRSAGYDVVGDLEELVPASQDPELRHPSDVSDAEVLDSALVAIERMLTDVRTLTLQRDRMRARAAKRVGAARRPAAAPRAVATEQLT